MERPPIFLNWPSLRADALREVTVMHLPQHFFRLQAAPTQRDSEVVRVVPRTEVQWGGPIFRAPALPTPHQLGSELPFFVNFPSKQRRVS